MGWTARWGDLIPLSGEQGQRLVVVRAVLSRPRLLVLDEAVGALDSATE